MDSRPRHPIQAVQSFQVRAGKVGTRWLDVGIRYCNSAQNDDSSWPRRSPIRSRCMKFVLIHDGRITEAKRREVTSNIALSLNVRVNGTDEGEKWRHQIPTES